MTSPSREGKSPTPPADHCGLVGLPLREMERERIRDLVEKLKCVIAKRKWPDSTVASAQRKRQRSAPVPSAELALGQCFVDRKSLYDSPPAAQQPAADSALSKALVDAINEQLDVGEGTERDTTRKARRKKKKEERKRRGQGLSHGEQVAIEGDPGREMFFPLFAENPCVRVQLPDSTMQDQAAESPIRLADPAKVRRQFLRVLQKRKRAAAEEAPMPDDSDNSDREDAIRRRIQSVAVSGDFVRVRALSSLSPSSRKVTVIPWKSPSRQTRRCCRATGQLQGHWESYLRRCRKGRPGFVRGHIILQKQGETG